MFDDFTPSPEAKKSRSRLGGSVAVACLLYVGGGTTLVAATAGANRRLEIEVEAIKGPPPEPPAPIVEKPAVADKPQVKAPPKPKGPVAPKSISKEKLGESSAALKEAGETGPVDPPPPEPPPTPSAAATPVVVTPRPPAPEPLIPPVEIEVRRPKYPEAARDLQVEGVVVVEFDVLPDGSVSNVRIISGPMEFHDAVTKAVATWRFKPARRGQLAVTFHKRQSIRFNFSD